MHMDRSRVDMIVTRVDTAGAFGGHTAAVVVVVVQVMVAYQRQRRRVSLQQRIQHFIDGSERGPLRVLHGPTLQHHFINVFRNHSVATDSFQNTSACDKLHYRLMIFIWTTAIIRMTQIRLKERQRERERERD